MEKICSCVMGNQISLVQVSKKYKMRLILKLINQLGIIEKKQLLFFSFCFSSSYCTNKLISFLSGIDVQMIAKYFEPCTWFGKGEYCIERDKFINAIELIQKSPVVIFDSVSKTSEEDYVKYIFDDSNNEVFVVDDLVGLCRNSNCSVEDVFKRIRKFANGKKVILIIDDVQYNDYLGYVDEFFVIDNLDSSVFLC